MVKKGIRAGQIVGFIGLLVWGSFINGYLSGHAVCRDCIAPIAVLNHFAHWVTLAALAVFVFIVPVLVWVKKSRRLRLLMAGWLLPGVIAFGWWYGPAFLPRPAPDVEGLEFTAATYNVMGFGADPAETFAVIQDMNADLVALQELRPTLEHKLQTELVNEYPYRISQVVQGLDGYALLSRYPILDYQIELDEDSEYRNGNPRYVRALIDFSGQTIVVYVFHPTIPDLPPRLYFPTTYNDEILWQQVKGLVNLIRTEDAPVLVLCDCNSTPRSRQYALLHQHLNEAYGERGWGFGLTFPADRPMIRIDYVWYSDAFEALEAKVWSTGGTSDHRPLWTRLILK
ncbi:MAG: hypothetical protein DPW16_19340 [Chloroflexi bacterium]|nr:hypothetical protein [Chloroflexota bacterium]